MGKSPVLGGVSEQFVFQRGSFLPQLGFEMCQNCAFVPKMCRNLLFEVGGLWRVVEGTERIVTAEVTYKQLIFLALA